MWHGELQLHNHPRGPNVTMVIPNISRLPVRELLQLESAIVAELRRRGLVRTNNKALGDIAECVVAKARGGRLEPNSTKSHDVTTADGKRVQVKAMGQRAAAAAAKFSVFRSSDFDTAVFLVFAPDTFELTHARECLPSEIKAVARFSSHTNGYQPTMRQILSVGRDVTLEMRDAYELVACGLG